MEVRLPNHAVRKPSPISAPDFTPKFISAPGTPISELSFLQDMFKKTGISSGIALGPNQMLAFEIGKSR